MGAKRQKSQLRIDTMGKTGASLNQIGMLSAAR